MYLFTRYLLPENTSKLYSSLHTKQKHSSRLLTSNYIGSIFFNNSPPISSNLFKFHPNNLEFPKRDIGTHKNLRSFFFSFISCCAGAYAAKAAAALSGSWKSRDFFIGSFSHSAVLPTGNQTSDIYEGSKQQ